MFELTKEFLANLKEVLLPEPISVPAGPGIAYATCAGCSGTCKNSCKGTCKGSCQGGCTRSCKGHSR